MVVTGGDRDGDNMSEKTSEFYMFPENHHLHHRHGLRGGRKRCNGDISSAGIGSFNIRKEKGSGPVYVESIGGTSAVPGDGLYSTPFQMYSPFCQMNDKKKDS
ncbi:hypothetical protein R6Q59_018373 [Mikania micrantha]